MCGRGRQSRVASGVVVGRRRFDELPQPTHAAAAASTQRPVTGCAVRARVDAREVDVGVDGAERSTQHHEDDEHDETYW